MKACKKRSGFLFPRRISIYWRVKTELESMSKKQNKKLIQSYKSVHEVSMFKLKNVFPLSAYKPN